VTGTRPRRSSVISRAISLLLAYEVTRDLPLASVPTDTPLEPMLSSTCRQMQRLHPARRQRILDGI
jgi:uracil phosphoribosyltransferase